MTPRYLLDTDICIAIQRRRPAHVIGILGGLAVGEAAMSIISYGELHFGVQKGGDQAAARQLLAALVDAIPIVQLSVAAAESYGRLRRELERNGQIIGANDLWIASHALASGLTLVTNNTREFARVPGLRFENWIERDSQ